jgi:hypothetical protein
MSTGMRVDADSTLYDFPSFAELNRLVQGVQSTYSDQADLNDVEIAILSFACGVAMQMDYSSEGSGASPYAAQDALLNKFGLYSADMFGSLGPDSYLVLQENVINRLPAMIGMRPTDGYGGHGIVCDGYNTDGEYHLNWGWGPSYPQRVTEAWYRLPAILYPYDFVITETVLNIRPNEPVLTTDPASMRFYGAPGQESEAQTLRIHNRVGDVTVHSISSPEGFLIGTADAFSDHIPSFSLPRPKEASSIQVKFRPERAGGYYGTLAIHYDDGNVRYVILRGWSFDGGTQITAGAVSGTWLLEKSPYFVTGDIQVPADGELIIEAGVKVFFMGPYGLTVGKKARLAANGTAAQPIELTAWNHEAGWTGLRFLSSGSDDVLRYCSLTWARKTGGLIPTAASGLPRPGSADSLGGAIYCYGSDLTVESCKITNNMGDSGAVYCANSNAIISNTLIANNTSLGGIPRCGGLSAYVSGELELRNCTIVNNSPGGVFAGSWDGMSMTNTIVWGNDLYQIEAVECAPAVTFCDVQGGYRGEGNMSIDPAFLSPSAGAGIEYDGSAANWALQTRSPCINAAAEAQDLPATDIAGVSRISSGVLDLGAWENQSDLPLMTIAPSRTADAGFVPLNESMAIQLDLTNTGKQDFTVQSLSIPEGDKAFTLLTPVTDRVLAPGDSVLVEIAFRPMREATYRGRLDIRSTASNASRIQVALQGMGVSGMMVSPGSVSGTWRKTASPYVVTGDIQVARGKTLTIEPGVTVKFAGHFGLTVGYRGTLRAMGTEQDRIVFTASDKHEGWFGIRFINSVADDTLQYCTLEYSKKPRTGAGGVPNLFGGAVLCYGSWEDEPWFPLVCSPRIESCRLAYNHAYVGGAIACLDGPEPIITKNTIVDNTSDYDGAGIALYDALGTITNNVIARNSAGTDGGGIVNVVSSPSIANNTIVSNRPSALHLESAYKDYFGDVQIMSLMNNIVWHNEIRMSDQAVPEAFRIRFNDIQGGWAGEGNIDKDPCFANAAGGDYHLKSQAGRWDPATKTWVTDSVTSPCIDAGDPASNVGQEPEPNGQRTNMGAYGGTDQASKSPGS